MYLVSEEGYRRIWGKAFGGGGKIGGPVTAGRSVKNIEGGQEPSRISVSCRQEGAGRE